MVPPFKRLNVWPGHEHIQKHPTICVTVLHEDYITTTSGSRQSLPHYCHTEKGWKWKQ